MAPKKLDMENMGLTTWALGTYETNMLDMEACGTNTSTWKHMGPSLRMWENMGSNKLDMVIHGTNKMEITTNGTNKVAHGISIFHIMVCLNEMT